MVEVGYAGHMSGRPLLDQRAEQPKAHNDDCDEDMTCLGVESLFAHATDNDLFLNADRPDLCVDFGSCFRSCFHGSEVEHPAGIWAECEIYQIAGLVAVSSQEADSHVDVSSCLEAMEPHQMYWFDVSAGKP